jgi:hypothetical protein
MKKKKEKAITEFFLVEARATKKIKTGDNRIQCSGLVKAETNPIHPQ